MPKAGDSTSPTSVLAMRRITIGTRVIGPEIAKPIADTWLPLAFDPNCRSTASVAVIDAIQAGRGDE